MDAQTEAVGLQLSVKIYVPATVFFQSDWYVLQAISTNTSYIYKLEGREVKLWVGYIR